MYPLGGAHERLAVPSSLCVLTYSTTRQCTAHNTNCMHCSCNEDTFASCRSLTDAVTELLIESEASRWIQCTAYYLIMNWFDWNQWLCRSTCRRFLRAHGNKKLEFKKIKPYVSSRTSNSQACQATCTQYRTNWGTQRSWLVPIYTGFILELRHIYYW